MRSHSDDPLAVLVGQELSAVTFVCDYIQLHFDGPLLTLYAPPIAQIGARQYEWGDQGYRDSLCACIGQTITRVLGNADTRIELGFQGGMLITVLLHIDTLSGPEAAEFYDERAGQRRWIVY